MAAAPRVKSNPILPDAATACATRYRARMKRPAPKTAPRKPGIGRVDATALQMGQMRHCVLTQIMPISASVQHSAVRSGSNFAARTKRPGEIAAMGMSGARIPESLAGLLPVTRSAYKLADELCSPPPRKTLVQKVFHAYSPATAQAVHSQPIAAVLTASRGHPELVELSLSN